MSEFPVSSEPYEHSATYRVGWQKTERDIVLGDNRVCATYLSEVYYSFEKAVEVCQSRILKDQSVVNAFVTKSVPNSTVQEVCYLCVMTDAFGHRCLPMQVGEFGRPSSVTPIRDKLK